jgi:lysophospholipid acyltransferase (LPLAT)-like uncharacterized protein
MLFVWHNRLFVIPWLHRRYRPGRVLYGLVSASRDGAWLAELLECFGIRSVRGSSSWRGGQALRELCHRLKDSRADLGITPDGPRGPRYRFKEGGILLAKTRKLPVLFVGVHFTRYWRLKSWDRFRLPKPFSTVYLRVSRENVSDWPESELNTRAQGILEHLCRPEPFSSGNG